MVNFSIPVDMLNFTNAAYQRVVEAGEFEILVGASSGDIKSKEPHRSHRCRPRARPQLAKERWQTSSCCRSRRMREDTLELATVSSRSRPPR